MLNQSLFCKLKSSFKLGNIVLNKPEMDCHVVENQDCVFNVHAIVSQYSKNKEKWHFKRQLGLIHLGIIACNNSSCSSKCIFHAKMHCHGFCQNSRNLVKNEALQARGLHSQFCGSFTLWRSDCKMHVVDLPPFLEWDNWKHKPSTLGDSSVSPTEISRFPVRNQAIIPH